MTDEGKIIFVIVFQLAVIATPFIRRLFTREDEHIPISKMEIVMIVLNIVVAIPVGIGEMFDYIQDLYFPVAIVLASMLFGTTDYFLRRHK